MRHHRRFLQQIRNVFASRKGLAGISADLLGMGLFGIALIASVITSNASASAPNGDTGKQEQNTEWAQQGPAGPQQSTATATATATATYILTDIPSPEPTPIVTPTFTPTKTPTLTPTPTPTLTPTPTFTPTPTPTRLRPEHLVLPYEVRDLVGHSEGFEFVAVDDQHAIIITEGWLNVVDLSQDMPISIGRMVIKTTTSDIQVQVRSIRWVHKIGSIAVIAQDSHLLFVDLELTTEQNPHIVSRFDLPINAPTFPESFPVFAADDGQRFYVAGDASDEVEVPWLIIFDILGEGEPRLIVQTMLPVPGVSGLVASDNLLAVNDFNARDSNPFGWYLFNISDMNQPALVMQGTQERILDLDETNVLIHDRVHFSDQLVTTVRVEEFSLETGLVEKSKFEAKGIHHAQLYKNTLIATTATSIRQGHITGAKIQKLDISSAIATELESIEITGERAGLSYFQWSAAVGNGSHCFDQDYLANSRIDCIDGNLRHSIIQIQDLRPGPVHSNSPKYECGFSNAIRWNGADLTFRDGVLTAFRPPPQTPNNESLTGQAQVLWKQHFQTVLGGIMKADGRLFAIRRNWSRTPLYELLATGDRFHPIEIVKTDLEAYFAVAKDDIIVLFTRGRNMDLNYYLQVVETSSMTLVGELRIDEEFMSTYQTPILDGTDLYISHARDPKWQIVDLSTPENPVLKGLLVTGTHDNLTVQNKVMYLVRDVPGSSNFGASELLVYDASSPPVQGQLPLLHQIRLRDLPIKLGNRFFFANDLGERYQIQAAGNQLHIDRGAGWLSRLDLSNPRAPTLLEPRVFAQPSFKLYPMDQDMLIIRDSAVLTWSDHSDPSSIEQNQWSCEGVRLPAKHVSMVGKNLFIETADSNRMKQTYQWQYDLAVPSSPKLLKGLHLRAFSKFKQDGPNLYAISNSNQDIAVFDFDPEENLNLRDKWCAPDGLCPFAEYRREEDAVDPFVALTGAGGIIYTADSAGRIRILDSRQAREISEIGTLKLELGEAQIESMILKGPRLILLTSDGALHQVDISSPGTPLHLGQIDTFGGPTSHIIEHGNLIIAAQGDVVKLIDFENPNRPRLRSSVDLASPIHQLTTDKNKLYVLQHDGFWHLRISDPDQPQVLGRTPLDFPGQIAVKDDVVYYLHEHRAEVEVLIPGVSEVERSYATWLPMLVRDY